MGGCVFVSAAATAGFVSGKCPRLRPNRVGQNCYADHLGTPRAITRPSDNQLVWKWDNTEPFGNNTANENPSGLGAFPYNLRHPGQYSDQETGTFYNYFRDYDPATGKYRQSDPIGLLGGSNTFAYSNSSPLQRIDPFGLASICLARDPESQGCIHSIDIPWPEKPLPPQSRGECYTRCFAKVVVFGVAEEKGAKGVATFAEKVMEIPCHLVHAGEKLATRALLVIDVVKFLDCPRVCEPDFKPWNTKDNPDYPKLPPIKMGR